MKETRKKGKKRETEVVASSDASHGFYLEESRKCDKVPTKTPELTATHIPKQTQRLFVAS